MRAEPEFTSLFIKVKEIIKVKEVGKEIFWAQCKLGSINSNCGIFITTQN